LVDKTKLPELIEGGSASALRKKIVIEVEYVLIGANILKQSILFLEKSFCITLKTLYFCTDIPTSEAEGLDYSKIIQASLIFAILEGHLALSLHHKRLVSRINPSSLLTIIL
jgi:hypothetical protein